MDTGKISRFASIVSIIAIILNPLGYVIVGAILSLIGGISIGEQGIGSGTLIIMYLLGLITLLAYLTSIIMYYLLKKEMGSELPNKFNILRNIIIVCIIIWIVVLVFI